MRFAYDKARNWVTPHMLVTFVIFGTWPLWIEAVGLYSYIGVEVLIWIVFALGFNLLLGYTGLPSFGHGAFLGVGGYAFGWFQFNVMPNLWLALAFAAAGSTRFRPWWMMVWRSAAPRAASVSIFRIPTSPARRRRWA